MDTGIDGLIYFKPNGKRPQMPWISPDVFKRARREMKGTQEKLL